MSRLEQLKKLAEADPDDPLARYAIGLEYANGGEAEPAIAAFEAALRIDPKYVPAYYHKARTELKAGRAEAARQTLSMGIEVARAADDAKTVREMQDLLDTIQ